MTTQRQDHFFRANLINCAQALHEVRRRINMCPPLADMREQFRKKARSHRVWTLVVPVNRLSRFIRKPGKRGIPDANACVRSTYFLEASSFWTFQRLGLSAPIASQTIPRDPKRDQNRDQGTTSSENISALLNNTTSKPPTTLNISGKVQRGLVSSRLSIWDTTYQQVITNRDARGDSLKLFALRRIKTKQNFFNCSNLVL